MELTKKTYQEYDRAKLIIPSLEIRFYDNKCHFYVEGKSIYWVSGPVDYINETVNSVCFGIRLAGSTVPSLKKTLEKL